MAFDILKEKRRAALAVFCILALAYAVCDFCYLQNRVSFGTNLLQLAGAVERRNPVAQVVVGQCPLPENARLYGHGSLKSRLQLIDSASDLRADGQVDERRE